jgi:anthranilate synthase
VAIKAAPIESADSYTTRGGVVVHRVVEEIPVANAIEHVIDALDSRRGALFASSYEYPGRYTRWDMGFVDPPLELVSRDRSFRVTALNARGRLILPALARAVAALPAVERHQLSEAELSGEVRPPAGRFAEEERSKQPSVFSVLRALVELFYSADDPHLGLYGAFGYDLAFQFEPLKLRLERPVDQRDSSSTCPMSS